MHTCYRTHGGIRGFLKQAIFFYSGKIEAMNAISNITNSLYHEFKQPILCLLIQWSNVTRPISTDIIYII